MGEVVPAEHRQAGPVIMFWYCCPKQDVFALGCPDALQ